MMADTNKWHHQNVSTYTNQKQKFPLLRVPRKKTLIYKNIMLRESFESTS